MSHMKCRNCGDEQLESEVYCSKCGHALHPDEHVGAQHHVHRSTKAEYSKNLPLLLVKVLVPLVVVLVVGLVLMRHAHRAADERALLDAARAGDQAGLEALLNGGVSANVRDDNGSAPVHLVLLAAQQPEAARAALLDLLLSHGADVNAKDEKGVTPLHLAAAAGLSSVVGVLMAHGADVNVQDANHRTPLMAARKGLEDTAKQYNLDPSNPGSLLIVQSQIPALQGYLGTVELIAKRDKSELRGLPSATTGGEVAGQ